MDLVLLPGFMLDFSLWDEVVEAFEEIGPVTFGDLSRDASIAGMAQHVLQQAPPRFALVGFSMGGYVAREIARMAPERIQALVLVATSARADTKLQAGGKAAAAESVKRSGFRGISRQAIVKSLHPDRAGDAAMIEHIIRMGDRLGRDAFLNQASQRESDLDRLGEIRCPVLVVAAKEDVLRSVEESQELRDGIAGAVMTVIEGSGHMLPLEAPDALVRAMVPWLRRVVPQG